MKHSLQMMRGIERRRRRNTLWGETGEIPTLDGADCSRVCSTQMYDD